MNFLYLANIIEIKQKNIYDIYINYNSPSIY